MIKDKLGSAVLIKFFTVAKYLVTIDAAMYVIDCLPNMNAGSIDNNTAALVHYIRAAKPTTPIFFVAGTTANSALYRVLTTLGTNYGNHWAYPQGNDAKRAALKSQVEALMKEVDHVCLFLNEGVMQNRTPHPLTNGI